jgi:hypothetical protein
MGRECDAHTREMRNAYRISVGRPEGKLSNEEHN